MAENCKEGSKEGSKTHRQTRLHRHRDLAKKGLQFIDLGSRYSCGRWTKRSAG